MPVILPTPVQFGAVLKEDPKTKDSQKFYWEGTPYWATNEHALELFQAARDSFDASSSGAANMSRGKPRETLWSLFEMGKALGRSLKEMLKEFSPETKDEMVIGGHEMYRLTKKKLAFVAEERPFDDELKKVFR